MSAFIFEPDDLKAAIYCARGRSLDGCSVVIALADRIVVFADGDELPDGVDVEIDEFDGRLHHADRRVIAAFEFTHPTYYTTSWEIACEQAQKRSIEGRRHSVVIFRFGRIATWEEDCSLGRPELFVVVDATDSILDDVTPDQIVATYTAGRIRPNLHLVGRNGKVVQQKLQANKPLGEAS